MKQESAANQQLLQRSQRHPPCSISSQYPRQTSCKLVLDAHHHVP